MKHLLPLLSFATALLLAEPAWAVEEATRDEAKAMAIKAAAFLKSADPTTAFAAFDAKDGPWQDPGRGLFVVVIDAKGMMVAHGTNPGLIGKNVLDLKDVDGKPFNREWVSVTDAAWVSFKWRNLLTNMVAPKVVYVVHVGDYFVGVGTYAK
jgi:hypothetical protein